MKAQQCLKKAVFGKEGVGGGGKPHRPDSPVAAEVAGVGCSAHTLQGIQ